MSRVEKSEDEWRKLLGNERYRICREGGTEPAFSGIYYDCKESGVYRCGACHTPLFLSSVKYDSGSGWPSFYQPINSEAIKSRADNTLGMERIEILCAACDSHLGHVFNDGPEPTGLRYCVNSASLDLKSDESVPS